MAAAGRDRAVEVAGARAPGEPSSDDGVWALPSHSGSAYAADVDHPITDISALPVHEIADYSFHDSDRFRIDPATQPAARREAMAGNAATLARYAGDPFMHDPDLRGRLAEIALPVRVVWGVSDRVVTPGYGRAYAEAIPRAESVVLDGAGHLPQVEQPARTRDLVWESAERHARTL